MRFKVVLPAGGQLCPESTEPTGYSPAPPGPPLPGTSTALAADTLQVRIGRRLAFRSFRAASSLSPQGTFGDV